MSSLLSPAQWDKFNKAINLASDTFNNTSILWHRKVVQPFNYGEESRQYSSIVLRCLVDYNDTMRVPFDKISASGKLSDTYIAVFFNNQHLKDVGFLDINGIFVFNPGEDYFEFDGDTWVDSGNTPASPSDIHSLHTIMILVRKPRNNQQALI